MKLGWKKFQNIVPMEPRSPRKEKVAKYAISISFLLYLGTEYLPNMSRGIITSPAENAKHIIDQYMTLPNRTSTHKPWIAEINEKTSTLKLIAPDSSTIIVLDTNGGTHTSAKADTATDFHILNGEDIEFFLGLASQGVVVKR